MPSLCFYFQVHQPKRLRHYTVFDIGKSHIYEDDASNSTIFKKVAEKCYLPTNHLMLKLIEKYKGSFKIAYSFSGIVIEQMKTYAPQVLDSFKALVNTGCVEILSETYFHSLAFLYSEQEFKKQITQHQELIESEFGVKPKIFRNTELIYNNHIAKIISELGYQGILAEGSEKILDWRSPNFLYASASNPNLKLLLKNYKLSDDIAFRFSNRSWDEYPLTAEKYSHWLHKLDANAEIINLFMDYETFGEHQWKDTGIFEFMKALPEHVFKHPSFNFQTPSELIQNYSSKDLLDVPNYVSWADVERDLSAWQGNPLQDDSLEAVMSMEANIYKTQDVDLIRTWQALTTSDHFYYMCTKWFSDGDVHKYFNPYESPYEAYINYQNILSDFSRRLTSNNA